MTIKKNRGNSRQRRARRVCATASAPVLALAIFTQLPVAAAAATSPGQGVTVYTLEPLNYGLFESTPLALQGKMCQAPNTCVHVDRPAVLDPTQGVGPFKEYGSIAKGAVALDNLIVDGDPALVMGLSQGSSVAGYWLTNYADKSEVDPSRVPFLLLSDPGNTYGVPWAPKVPTNTGFDVTEMWVQYDGWADWPTRWSPVAVANAVYGLLFVHPQGMVGVDPSDPDIVEWSADGINYRMVPSPELPLLDPLRNLGLGWVADALNDSLVAEVEAAYDRPSSQAEADVMFASTKSEPTATDGVPDGAIPEDETAELVAVEESPEDIAGLAADEEPTDEADEVVEDEPANVPEEEIDDELPEDDELSSDADLAEVQLSEVSDAGDADESETPDSSDETSEPLGGGSDSSVDSPDAD